MKVQEVFVRFAGKGLFALQHQDELKAGIGKGILEGIDIPILLKQEEF